MASDPAEDRFDVSDRERAAFETGIKLGAMFHQFLGAPVSRHNVADVERAIASCLATQPFVVDAEVRIDREPLRGKTHEYDYAGLAPEMLRIRVRVRYGGALAEGVVRFDADLDYPLMVLEFLNPDA